MGGCKPPTNHGGKLKHNLLTGDRKEPQQDLSEPRTGAARQGAWLSTSQQQGFVGKLNGGDGKAGRDGEQ